MSESAEQELRQRTPGRRVLALDALRGLAAFVVIWHHFRLSFVTGEPRWYLRPLFAGRSAVVLFFVLSGYVLSMPYWQGRQMPYGKYLLRRILRIYAPYAAAVTVALLVGSHLLYSHLPLSPWFYKTWQEAFTPQLILNQFLTMSTGPEVNTAFWSLRYEMEMSIVFPFICWAMMRLGGWWSLVIALAIEGTVVYLFKIKIQVPARVIGEGLLTLLWGSCFLYGALLCWKRDKITAVYSKTPLWVKAIFLILSVVVYHYTLSSLIPFAACGIIIFAERSWVQRFLDTAVPEYLGRISYSIYLLHGTVLYATLILLYGKINFVALTVVYFSITLLAAHIFCVAIEEPAMRLGKRLTQPRPIGSKEAKELS